jgi:hypothetical protein
MRKVRCKGGNKRCGGRCVPKDYVCASLRSENLNNPPEMPTGTKDYDVTAEKRLSVQDLATYKDPLKKNRVTNESAPKGSGMF